MSTWERYYDSMTYDSRMRSHYARLATWAILTLGAVFVLVEIALSF